MAIDPEFHTNGFEGYPIGWNVRRGIDAAEILFVPKKLVAGRWIGDAKLHPKWPSAWPHPELQAIRRPYNTLNERTALLKQRLSRIGDSHESPIWIESRAEKIEQRVALSAAATDDCVEILERKASARQDFRLPMKSH